MGVLECKRANLWRSTVATQGHEEPRDHGHAPKQSGLALEDCRNAFCGFKKGLDLGMKRLKGLFGGMPAAMTESRASGKRSAGRRPSQPSSKRRPKGRDDWGQEASRRDHFRSPGPVCSAGDSSRSLNDFPLKTGLRAKCPRVNVQKENRCKPYAAEPNRDALEKTKQTPK